jgi:hypothetical protein
MKLSYDFPALEAKDAEEGSEGWVHLGGHRPKR